MISLALFMTFYVMAPTFDRAWQNGVQPLMQNEISEQEAYSRITDPFRDFMLAHVREKDLQTFESLAAEGFRTRFDDKQIDLRVIIPAFMISELRRAFEIGFLIMMPFLVIDMIVATLTMSMGMMMMPPTVFALPFKVLFFVLIDGWNLLAVRTGPVILIARSIGPGGAVVLAAAGRSSLPDGKCVAALLWRNAGLLG